MIGSLDYSSHNDLEELTQGVARFLLLEKKDDPRSYLSRFQTHSSLVLASSYDNAGVPWNVEYFELVALPRYSL
jgi:hypothetical protein